MRTRPLAVLAAVLFASLAAAQPRKATIPPRTVTLSEPASTLGKVAAEIARQGGVPVIVAPELAGAPCRLAVVKAPFWAALEDAARQAGARIVPREAGRQLTLEPLGNAVERSSVHGAFRTVAREVRAHLDLETGRTTYDLRLDAQWEPQVRVFRISRRPGILAGADNRNTRFAPVEAEKSEIAPNPVGGALHHLAPVTLTGLTRESISIATLSGYYQVLAAEKMLAFRFDAPGGKLPITPPSQEGVSATLKRFAFDKDLRTWEAEVELTYPADQPAFKSSDAFSPDFWMHGNRVRLVAPGAARSFLPESYEIPDPEQRLAAVYRFKEDPTAGLTNPTAKGWSLVYETPSPLIQVRVPFELKDIPLP